MQKLKEPKKNNVMMEAIPPTQEQMEMEAYYHWMERGCPFNDALTDWVEVERKLRGAWVAGEGDD